LDGEEPFALRIENGFVSFVNEKLPDPHVTFYSDSDTFFDIITGTINQDSAFLNGLVDIEGSITDAVIFKHIGEILRSSHPRLFTTIRTLSRLI
jgi:putative sterol carrier protein